MIAGDKDKGKSFLERRFYILSIYWHTLKNKIAVTGQRQNVERAVRIHKTVLLLPLRKRNGKQGLAFYSGYQWVLTICK